MHHLPGAPPTRSSAGPAPRSPLRSRPRHAVRQSGPSGPGPGPPARPARTGPGISAAIAGAGRRIGRPGRLSLLDPFSGAKPVFPMPGVLLLLEKQRIHSQNAVQRGPDLVAHVARKSLLARLALSASSLAAWGSAVPLAYRFFQGIAMDL